MIRHLVIVCALASTVAAYAQSISRWENLQQLTPGQKIRVIEKDHGSWTGSFVSLSNDSISLKTASGEKSVARAAVRQVSRHGGKRGRNALIGAAVGGGTGAGVGAGIAGCGAYGPCANRGAAAAIAGGIAGVIGAAIGCAFPGNTVIYRAQ